MVRAAGGDRSPPRRLRATTWPGPCQIAAPRSSDASAGCCCDAATARRCYATGVGSQRSAAPTGSRTDRTRTAGPTTGGPAACRLRGRERSRTRSHRRGAQDRSRGSALQPSRRSQAATPRRTRARSRYGRPASGSPSVWPTCSAGCRCAGRGSVRMPGVGGAPDVVEEPVADERRSAPGRSTPTASIAAAERLGRRLRPRDLAGVDVAVDEVEDAVAAEEALVPGPRPDRVGEHADLEPVDPQPARTAARTSGSVERVRLPELVVGRQQRRVVVEPGLGEEVRDGRALLVVARAAPDRLRRPRCSALGARVGVARRRPPARQRPRLRVRSRRRATGSACRPSRR